MKITRDKKTLDRAEKIIAADGNQEKWENGELGRNPETMAPVPEDDVNEFYRRRGKQLKMTSIRLDNDMIEKLAQKAHSLGMGYQTYIRMILSKHLKDEDKNAS